MKMARKILTCVVFLIHARYYASADTASVLSTLEESLENKLSDCVYNVAKWLENFNDRNLGNSELGRLIHYKDIKPKYEEVSGRRRSMKKMSMGMLPLIFHMGATSTWMILTTILAAKSVAIGIALLVFKIAVSSAKVAAFFTALKNKHSDHHHGWSWAPHYEHHGHERSLTGFDSHISSAPLHSYSPEWIPDHPQGYNTIPTLYKEHPDHEGPYPDITYAGETRKRDSKYHQ